MSMPKRLSPFNISRRKLGYFLFEQTIVPVYEWKKYTVHPDKLIMNSLLNHVATIFANASKVMVLRFDLHLKNYSEDNQIMSLFGQSLSLLFKQHYTQTWCQLLWVREHGRSQAQHYHCVLIINGQKIQHPGKLNKLIEQLWKPLSGGSYSLPKNCFYRWTSGDNVLLGQIIYRISYLAKNITKCRFNAQTKRYGARWIAGKKFKRREDFWMLVAKNQVNYTQCEQPHHR